VSFVFAYGTRDGVQETATSSDVEEAHRVRRLGEVFVLELSVQGREESDLSCLDRTSEIR